jgi:hypothetical protein
MQTKHHKITIQSYLDFKQLFQDYQGTHKENRLFALKHKNSKNLVFLWLEEYRFKMLKPFYSDTFSLYSNSLNNIVSFISLLLGLFMGIGLLSYSGNEPVNIIYYLFFATLLPILSMIFTLFSILSKWNISDFFKMLFPFHWLEKLLSKFTLHRETDSFDEVLSKPLQKYLFIERLQRFSLIFSIGILLALLFIVVTQDIAFVWSTTLQVEALSFYGFLEFIATPWRFIFPSFMPSPELVELSQHYRLGEKLNTNMIENAHRLGAWWQYLAMNTFFYAVVLRFTLWIFSTRYLIKKVQEEFFDLYGVRKLVKEFKTPFIETKAPKKEKHLEIKKEHKKQVKTLVETRVQEEPKVQQLELKTESRVEPLKVIKEEKIEEEPKKEDSREEESIQDIEKDVLSEVIDEQYHSIIAWNFSEDEMLLVNDTKRIDALFSASVGGNNSFEEDEEVANRAEENVLLYVKSWEPPTMDFVDFLEELIENSRVDEIELFPIGLPENNYRSTEKEFSIWNRKIEGLKAKKVWVIDAK